MIAISKKPPIINTDALVKQFLSKGGTVKICPSVHTLPDAVKTGKLQYSFHLIHPCVNVPGVYSREYLKRPFLFCVNCGGKHIPRKVYIYGILRSPAKYCSRCSHASISKRRAVANVGGWETYMQLEPLFLQVCTMHDLTSKTTIAVLIEQYLLRLKLTPLRDTTVFNKGTMRIRKMLNSKVPSYAEPFRSFEEFDF